MVEHKSTKKMYKPTKVKYTNLSKRNGKHIKHILSKLSEYPFLPSIKQIWTGENGNANLQTLVSDPQ